MNAFTFNFCSFTDHKRIKGRRNIALVDYRTRNAVLMTSLDARVNDVALRPEVGTRYPGEALVKRSSQRQIFEYDV